MTGALPSDGFLSSLASKLQWVDLQSIEAVAAALRAKHDLILGFVSAWLGDRVFGRVNPGISLFYLAYVLLAERQDDDLAKRYFEHFSLGAEAEKAPLVTRLREAYADAVSAGSAGG